ncbi:hypothetical protein MSIBF_A750001 [groundwater metagenome]|uniref:Uncharacterized protein n=1 Tax=groundwater metagenome TaxID=717931 RepID=A0A098ED50_9ZZZZ
MVKEVDRFYPTCIIKHNHNDGKPWYPDAVLDPISFSSLEPFISNSCA